MQLFDINKIKQHKKRAYASFKKHDFLWQEASEIIIDRFTDINKKFENILIIGDHTEYLAQKEFMDRFNNSKIYEVFYSEEHDLIENHEDLGSINRETITQLTSDSSSKFKLAHEDQVLGAINFEDRNVFNILEDPKNLNATPQLASGVELDLIISFMHMHWINDIVGFLTQIKHKLKKDGMFMAIFIGGESLSKFRHQLNTVDMDFNQSYGGRISPFIEVKQAAMLLQRTNFIDPVSDSYLLEASYSKIQDFFNDIKGMGEQNSLVKHNPNILSKELIKELQPNDADKNLEIMFELISVTGLNG